MAIGPNGDLGVPAQEHAEMVDTKLEPGAVLAISVATMVYTIRNINMHQVVHKVHALKAEPATSHTAKVRVNAICLIVIVFPCCFAIYLFYVSIL